MNVGVKSNFGPQYFKFVRRMPTSSLEWLRPLLVDGVDEIRVGPDHGSDHGSKRKVLKNKNIS